MKTCVHERRRARNERRRAHNERQRARRAKNERATSAYLVDFWKTGRPWGVFFDWFEWARKWTNGCQRNVSLKCQGLPEFRHIQLTFSMFFWCFGFWHSQERRAIELWDWTMESLLIDKLVSSVYEPQTVPRKSPSNISREKRVVMNEICNERDEHDERRSSRSSRQEWSEQNF